MLFNNSVRTSKRTPHFTITKINWLTLINDIIALNSDNHTKPINPLWWTSAELFIVKAGGGYSYHWFKIVILVQNINLCVWCS
jgi:hypothetical protein